MSWFFQGPPKLKDIPNERKHFIVVFIIIDRKTASALWKNVRSVLHSHLLVYRYFLSWCGGTQHNELLKCVLPKVWQIGIKETHPIHESAAICWATVTRHTFWLIIFKRELVVITSLSHSTNSQEDGENDSIKCSLLSNFNLQLFSNFDIFFCIYYDSLVFACCYNWSMTVGNTTGIDVSSNIA